MKKEFRALTVRKYVVLCVVELNNGGVQVGAKRPCLVEVREEVPGGRCVAGMGREECLLACPSCLFSSDWVEERCAGLLA